MIDAVLAHPCRAPFDPDAPLPVALALVALVLRRAGDSATQIARTMTGG